MAGKCLLTHPLLMPRTKARQNLMRDYKAQVYESTLAMLMTAVFILHVFMWCFAYYHNDMPTGVWGIYEGNHGPWRGTSLKLLYGYTHPLVVLRSTLSVILGLQFFAAAFSVGYLLLRNYRYRVLLLLPLNTLYFFVLIYQYVWLID
jgi:hypothetical protein